MREGRHSVGPLVIGLFSQSLFSSYLEYRTMAQSPSVMHYRQDPLESAHCHLVSKFSALAADCLTRLTNYMRYVASNTAFVV
jgi:hypothetical protein